MERVTLTQFNFRISWFPCKLTKTNKIDIPYRLIRARLCILQSYSIKGPTNITHFIWEGQIPSWSLTSLRMIRGIPNYRLYRWPFYGWCLTASRHTTLHVRNHGDLRLKDHVHHHHYETAYDIHIMIHVAFSWRVSPVHLFSNIYPCVDLIYHIYDLWNVVINQPTY